MDIAGGANAGLVLAYFQPAVRTLYTVSLIPAPRHFAQHTGDARALADWRQRQTVGAGPCHQV
jgi:hypothetical protein